jgi:hypothetical protein
LLKRSEASLLHHLKADVRWVIGDREKDLSGRIHGFLTLRDVNKATSIDISSYPWVEAGRVEYDFL